MDRPSVDAQCHVSPVWYEPVEALLDQMERVGVSQAVLIQMLGQTDNHYQQNCLKRFPGRFASVVLIDSSRPEALAELRKLADEGATGVRFRPVTRSPDPDPLAIWQCAADCRLAVSCVGNSATFATTEFAQLIAELPNLTIVLEHLGGTNQPVTDEAAQAQRLQVLGLARFPNVYMKIPGLGELMPRKLPPPAEGGPFDSGISEILRRAIAAFGPGRLMWGSDFPPVSAREGYYNSFALVREALQFLPASALDEIFLHTARRVFKLATLD